MRTETTTLSVLIRWQDEILEMEVKQLSRQLETKLGRSELM